MKRASHRLLYLLAASDFHARDIVDFCQWVREVGPYVVADQVQFMRNRLSEIPESYGEMRATREDRWAPPEIGRSQSNVGPKADVFALIDQVLRLEARLPAGEAAAMLTARLLPKIKSKAHRIPALQKSNFQNWLKRVSRIVPSSVLLQEAMRIRNLRVSSRRSDWPLRIKE